MLAAFLLLLLPTGQFLATVKREGHRPSLKQPQQVERAMVILHLAGFSTQTTDIKLSVFCFLNLPLPFQMAWYEFLVLYFGLRNLLASFQRLINNLLNAWLSNSVL